MKFLTGKKGVAHFTSRQFRAFVQSVIGSESYIAGVSEKPTVEVLDGNIIRIQPFMLVHHGGLFLIDDVDNVTYTNGTQGMKRIDLVVARYTKNGDGIENGEWVIIPGTPASSNPTVPSCNVGNMQDGDSVDDCPVFELTFDGLNITNVECLVPIVKSLSEKQNQIQGVTSLPADAPDGDVYIVYEE